MLLMGPLHLHRRAVMRMLHVPRGRLMRCRSRRLLETRCQGLHRCLVVVHPVAIAPTAALRTLRLRVAGGRCGTFVVLLRVVVVPFRLLFVLLHVVVHLPALVGVAVALAVLVVVTERIEEVCVVLVAFASISWGAFVPMRAIASGMRRSCVVIEPCAHAQRGTRC